MKHLGIFLITLFTVFTSLAQEKSNFIKANQKYTEGKYEEAISLYESLLDGEKHAATLYYNLGNAYFKNGKLANAILNYERAYQLAPSDKDIQTNLAFANTQVADKITATQTYFITKWFTNIVKAFNTNIWAYIGIGMWLIFFFALFLFIRSQSENGRKILFPILLISLLVSSLSLYASYSQYQEVHKDTYAIVFAENITIQSTPSRNGTELFILHEGTKVKVLDKVGNWHKIQLADEREGWIPSKEIVKI